MKRNFLSLAAVIISIGLLSACGGHNDATTSFGNEKAGFEEAVESSVVSPREETSAAYEEERDLISEAFGLLSEAASASLAEEKTESPSHEPLPEIPEGNGYVIAIDAGHCSKPETWLYEPVGPGATETKMKDTGGTVGRFTGIPEYELNLQLSLKLEAVLKERGYTVYMTRTENEVSLGNIDRAAVANDAEADAFIRIHANGAEDKSVNGALSICQTPYNPYVNNYADSRLLADCVLDELCSATGAYKRSVWETDTMAGLNWAKVPCTIIEVGFMTNKEEDELMATDEYRDLIAVGLANGIDKYIIEKAARSGAE